MADEPHDPTPYLTHRERRRLVWTSVLVALALVVFVALAVWGVMRLSSGTPGSPSSLPSPTPVDRPLYVDPASTTVAAAQKDARFEPLAEVPQAKWLTSWSTVQTAERDTATYLDGAEAAGQVPVLVLYQIPQRDCGSNARGGLANDDEYLEWIDAVVRGLDGHTDARVIVEPDALAMAGRCTRESERTELLAETVERLARTGASVYLDAGHSRWVDADVMARRLVESGVAGIRGFATNVSNFRSTQDERIYAESVREQLHRLGVDDVHYLIDVSRNGASVPEGDFCNPDAARIGQRPSLYAGTALDGLLWIKNPGESDGPCDGAPARGFWPDGALRVMGEG